MREPALDPETGQRVLQVAELLFELRARVAGHGGVLVEGEVGNLFRSRQDHCYFDLQDPEVDAQLRCVMFASRQAERDFELADGLCARVWARPDVYAPRGTLQLVVERIWPAGAGALRAALERLRQRLEAEGLFAPEHKRPLPRMPRRIGLVTSREGAAIHDFVTALRKRSADLEVVLCAARVQGPGAWRELVRGLHLLGAQAGIEAIILARGGGSFEDLFEFNREELVRAVFASEIPVISAVGHEIDVTLSDLVADVRAATPTAAAELVAPDGRALARGLASLSERLARRARERVSNASARIGSLRRALLHPAARLAALERRLGELKARGSRATREAVQSRAREAAELAARLARGSGALVAAPRARLERAGDRLFGLLRVEPGRRGQRLLALGAKLEVLSPLGVLARGFSVTRRADDGRIVRDARDVAPGDELEIELLRGALFARVREVRER